MLDKDDEIGKYVQKKDRFFLMDDRKPIRVSINVIEIFFGHSS